MVRTVKMEQDCQVGKPMPAADPNLTSPDNHHDLTASAREEVESTKENEEKKCQLYYYRTSQDVNPLGSIDLANATFGYPAQAQEGTFQIQIPGRVVVLKALNSQAMLYWLQQLQIKRWQHNTSLVKIPAEPSTTSTQLCQLPSAPWEGRTEDFLPAVKTPKGLVGEAAACLPDPWQQNALQKLSSSTPSQRYISFSLYFAFRSQFVFPLPCPYRNTVLNICGNKPAQELRRSVFNFDKIQQSEDCPCEDPVTQILGKQQFNAGTTTVALKLLHSSHAGTSSTACTSDIPSTYSPFSSFSFFSYKRVCEEAKTGGKSSPSSSMNKREKKMTSSLQPSGEKVSGKEGSPWTNYPDSSTRCSRSLRSSSHKKVYVWFG
ncbi:TBC1 domain family member 2A-like [Huso huso]|uniref:TBC1 domain family member 2A-like n=1 Tax=Huso huso TaxID=61971 RepID=A0ABR1A7Z9_HUSHU